VKVPDGGTMLDIMKDTVQHMGDKIPSKRHKQRLNIGFADGHAQNVGPDQFFRVRVSPYRF
jgi:prepilin-type processing-associated H-X9-DG protein